MTDERDFDSWRGDADADPGVMAPQSHPDPQPTDEWLRMVITHHAPKHVWHAGHGYPGDAFDGWTVHTDDHVYVHARGGGESPDGGGTTVVQSPAQSWWRATEGSLSQIAAANLVMATGSEPTSGLNVGAQGGVSVLADRRVVAGTVPITDPTAALPAENNANLLAGEWGTWWTAVDTTVALGLTAMDVFLSATVAGWPSKVAAITASVIGNVANIAGASANLYGLVGGAAGAPTLPGMTLAAEAGMLIGSEQGLTIWGVPGAVLGSMLTTVFAGVSTTAQAGLDASMSSLLSCDMSSVLATSVASMGLLPCTGTEVAARKGLLSVESDNLINGVSKLGPTEVRAVTGVWLTSGLSLDLVANVGAVSFRSQTNCTMRSALAYDVGLSPVAPYPPIDTGLAPMDPYPPPVIMPALPHASVLPVSATFAGGAEFVAGVLRITPLGVEMFAAAGAAGVNVTPTSVTLEASSRVERLAGIETLRGAIVSYL